ncbi:1-hydroxycarotenoid 3,4-desaturase CrtD [Portibacter marinus]|uniref:1-hydroxycarotenoid 3,4-desaturase CrtD n=1 Tax=Portibacter marinus TaxID=2898660 RepID=UPI001F33FA2A|nr:1-hydroxycarotenoid 3,4-desaturase CrtD [Portibacter marinus]
MTRKAVVIGSGIGGLSSAIRLAVKGYEVEVFEKNQEPGGKLVEFKLGPYRFDFGPSLFTMPQYVDELFAIAGRNPKDYFRYKSLDEACRYFYPDGLEFIAPTDPQKFAEKASEIFDVSEKQITKYFDYNEKILKKSGHIFLNEPVHKLKTFLNSKALNAAAQSYVIELFRSMNTANKKALKDPKLVKLFNRYATYNGSSPFQAPAILNSISVLEHLHGTYYPTGGMSSITQALYQLALSLQVKFTFNEKVDEILYEKSIVKGIRIGDKQVDANVVVSNMDVGLAYNQLLPKMNPPSFYANREKSSSAVIFYWGVRTQVKKLGLHNIFFAQDYSEEFEDIFNRKQIHADPTIYINNTSFYDSGDAPEGCSNWFVMVNAPAVRNINIDALRNNVILKLERLLKIDLADLIEEERVVTPQIIESQTLSHQGALYGSSSNSWINAFIRHPNFSGKLKGLYFVGGSVHPGGGIPLCLLSAKIATELIDE